MGRHSVGMSAYANQEKSSGSNALGALDEFRNQNNNDDNNDDPFSKAKRKKKTSDAELERSCLTNQGPDKYSNFVQNLQILSNISQNEGNFD